MFPEPISLISFFKNIFVSIKPKGIDPNKYELIATIKYSITITVNNSSPFTNVFVTLPWSFLSSMEVFLDLEISLSFLTTHGLSISTIQKSASLPTERLPLLIFKIFAGFDVKALIIVSNLTEPL